VVSDEGFDGTVILVQSRGVERLASPDGVVRLRVQAGEPWDALVAHTVEQGWAGIEALSGIPGSCGAGPIQNIGAYGQELSSSLVAIDFLDYLSGSVERLVAEELELGYRTSALKQGREGVVVAIEVELAASADGAVAYPQLASALGVELGSRVPLAQVRAGVLALRAAKGMLLDDADPDSVGCGSFFTNPIVGENFARGLPGDAPRWPVEPEPEDLVVPLGSVLPAHSESSDRVKLSAAWLIEQAGIGKGFALPGSRAAISSKHTLAITNRGGATAAEVAELARYIEAMVLSRFGVNLFPEPVPVGIEL
jgi:UDP-N-acetylmuramate dehydrogenase